MSGLLAAIAGLATPILARVLIALGFASVTLVGVQAAVNGLVSTLMSNLGNAPLIGLQIAGLAGVWVGLGYVLGAITFTLSLWGLTKVVRIAKA